MATQPDLKSDTVMLSVSGLTCAYGKVNALKGIDFYVRELEIVGIVGPNGAGKTTLLEAIVGTMPIKEGRVEFLGQRVERWTVWQRRRSGIMLIPQDGNVFPLMTVGKNFEVSVILSTHEERKGLMDYAYQLFPILWEKRKQNANTLSGGQQKMLAVALGLVSNASLLLVDEPSIGLAPKLVTRLFESFRKIRQDTHKTIVLSEQNIKVLDTADRLFGLEAGHIRFDEMTERLSRETVMSLYLGKAR